MYFQNTQDIGKLKGTGGIAFFDSDFPNKVELLFKDEVAQFKVLSDGSVGLSTVRYSWSGVGSTGGFSVIKNGKLVSIEQKIVPEDIILVKN